MDDDLGPGTSLFYLEALYGGTPYTCVCYYMSIYQPWNASSACMTLTSMQDGVPETACRNCYFWLWSVSGTFLCTLGFAMLMVSNAAVEPVWQGPVASSFGPSNLSNAWYESRRLPRTSTHMLRPLWASPTKMMAPIGCSGKLGGRMGEAGSTAISQPLTGSVVVLITAPVILVRLRIRKQLRSIALNCTLPSIKYSQYSYIWSVTAKLNAIGRDEPKGGDDLQVVLVYDVYFLWRAFHASLSLDCQKMCCIELIFIKVLFVKV